MNNDKEMKVDYSCSNCGCFNIVRSMFKWNLDKQSWEGEIDYFIDAGFHLRCFVCDGVVEAREISANNLVVEKKKPTMRKSKTHLRIVK